MGKKRWEHTSIASRAAEHNRTRVPPSDIPTDYCAGRWEGDEDRFWTMIERLHRYGSQEMIDVSIRAFRRQQAVEYRRQRLIEGKPMPEEEGFVVWSGMWVDPNNFYESTIGGEE